MKILNHHVSRMYITTILILLALVVESSYVLSTIPLGFIVAVIICSMTEVGIDTLYLNKQPRIPYSGIITGMIIGSVAPINAPLLMIIFASLIAIFSKFFIKSKNTNVFNHATLGLVVCFVIFGFNDQWWTAGTANAYGLVIPLSLALVLCAFEARRLVLAFSFVIAVAILTLQLTHATTQNISQRIIVDFLSINYFFTLLMLVEPKTSPPKESTQIVYGTFVAIAYYILALLGIPLALLSSLLLGNIAFAVYKLRGHKIY